MEIKETVGGDEKSWGLWHEHRGSVRRYTLQGRSTLVKLSWLKDLKELQQRSSLPTNSKCEGKFDLVIIKYSLHISNKYCSNYNDSYRITLTSDIWNPLVFSCVFFTTVEGHNIFSLNIWCVISAFVFVSINRPTSV